MAQRRKNLTNAPIVEAAIDIRLTPTTSVALEKIAAAGSLLGSDYTPGDPIRSIEATFSAEVEEMTQRRDEIGFLFRSTDQRRIAQFKIDGFTFNRLEPYTDWPSVFGEARRLWMIYQRLESGIRVARLGVRYINRMILPEGASLGEYLTTPPVLPEEFPQQVRQYLSRFLIEDVERNVSALVVQAIEPGAEKGTAALLLDIDAFCRLERPIEPDDPAFDGIFGQLRELKNSIFYASITEAAVERYE